MTDASLISEGKRMSVNTNKTEKDKALEAAMAQIQKQFGKGAIMKLGDESAQMNIDAISSGSISLVSRPASRRAKRQNCRDLRTGIFR